MNEIWKSSEIMMENLASDKQEKIEKIVEEVTS